MPQLVQPSFSAGELSPKLYGRVDLQRYSSGVAIARNMVVLPEGGLQNRAGTRYVALTGDGLADQRPVRVVPFRFSTDQAYVVELGEFYARFFANGAPVRVTAAPAWSNATTYAKKAFVTSGGVTYISRQASNLNHAPASSPAWWQQQDELEIETPWAGNQAMDLRFTQSADVMTFAHSAVRPYQLRRLAADVFELVPMDYREGPFTTLNANDAVVVSASARTGIVTVESNGDIFDAGMVGQLMYIELRDLTQIKPWTPGERTPGLQLNARRRSDGKTYQCVTIPTSGGAEYTETGSRPPTHDVGRAWDGGGDLRDNGSVQWHTGVEWEYRDSGYGIVLITGFTDARHVTGEVKRTLPDQVVGGVGSPAATWNLTGDGVTKSFAIAGATGYTYDYAVTISGVPVAADPPYSGGGAGSGGPGGNLP